MIDYKRLRQQSDEKGEEAKRLRLTMAKTMDKQTETKRKVDMDMDMDMERKKTLKSAFPQGHDHTALASISAQQLQELKQENDLLKSQLLVQ